MVFDADAPRKPPGAVFGDIVMSPSNPGGVVTIVNWSGVGVIGSPIFQQHFIGITVTLRANLPRPERGGASHSDDASR